MSATSMGLRPPLTAAGKPFALATDVGADRFSVTVLIVVIATITCEGPLRMVLSMAHVAPAIYLRDALVAIAVGRVMMQAARHHFVALLLTALLLLLHNLVGIWMLPKINQVLFGDKILLYAAFGASIAPLLARRDKSARIVLIAVLGVTCAGLLFNLKFNPAPWSKISSEIDGLRVSGIRTDYAGGAPRLAGFSRANTTAAGLVILSCISLMLIYPSRYVRLLLVLLPMPFIYLTNSKSIAPFYLLATLPLLLPATFRTLGKPLCVVALILCAAIPLLLFGTYFHIPQGDASSLFSLVDRIDRSWPHSWSLIADHGSVLLGRGIGGIGSPQKAYEAARFAEADNAFIYLYAYTGAFALLYVVGVIYLVIRAKPFASPRAEFAIAILGLQGLMGSTAIIFEDQYALMYLCAAIALLYKEKPSIWQGKAVSVPARAA